MKNPISLDDLETLEGKIISSICPEYYGNLGSVSEVYLCKYILEDTFKPIIKYVKEYLQIKDPPVIYFVDNTLYFKIFIKNNILNFKSNEEMDIKIKQISEQVIDKIGINSVKYRYQFMNKEYIELTFFIKDNRFKTLLKKVDEYLKQNIINMNPLTKDKSLWEQAQKEVIEGL